MQIDRRQTTHDFEKQNLVTLRDRKGTYDLYKCVACGLAGKQYVIGTLTISARNKTASAKCPRAETPRRVKIVDRFISPGRRWNNLIPGSVHEVVDAPKGQSDRLAGVWVMGVGEPVKILVGEYEEVE